MEKMALKERLVKYIFPGSGPTIAIGEDGYIIYDFKYLYPSKLAIFIPIEVEHSNFNNKLPKSFDAYFRNADAEIARLSRLTEKDLGNQFKGLGVEYIPGKVLQRQDNRYTVFRFDWLVDSGSKTDALCRAKFRGLSIGDRKRITGKPYFNAMASSLDGREYLYWIMPINEFFNVNKAPTDGSVTVLAK